MYRQLQPVGTAHQVDSSTAYEPRDWNLNAYSRVAPTGRPACRRVYTLTRPCFYLDASLCLGKKQWPCTSAGNQASAWKMAGLAIPICICICTHDCGPGICTTSYCALISIRRFESQVALLVVKVLRVSCVCTRSRWNWAEKSRRTER